MNVVRPAILLDAVQHTYLDDPTLADAILDRIVHSSHKIDLKTTKSLRDNQNSK